MTARSPSPSVSVIVASHNEGAWLRRTVHGLLGTLPADAEVVVVDDASEDGSADSLATGYPAVRLVRSEHRLGSPAARNAGAAVATGDVLVFCDAHVVPPFGWVEPLIGVLGDDGVGAVGPAVSVLGTPANVGYGLTFSSAALHVEWLPRRAQTPYEVPILGAAFIAMRREVVKALGGFDSGLVSWGGEDIELSLRLWLSGRRLLVVPAVTVAHRFRSALPHTLAAGALAHNRLRIGTIHLSRERLARVAATQAGDPDLPGALARLLDSDAALRRRELQDRRRHDDDWYFERFGDPMLPTEQGVRA